MCVCVRVYVCIYLIRRWLVCLSVFIYQSVYLMEAAASVSACLSMYLYI